jgi:hypothetical protein
VRFPRAGGLLQVSHAVFQFEPLRDNFRVVDIRKLFGNVSALSEARFRESVKLGEVLFARSIEPFEGGCWRLRWMRANGYGNSIFSPTCKLLVLRYLENEHVREPQFDALRWGMTCGA